MRTPEAHKKLFLVLAPSAHPNASLRAQCSAHQNGRMNAGEAETLLGGLGIIPSGTVTESALFARTSTR